MEITQDMVAAYIGAVATALKAAGLTLDPPVIDAYDGIVNDATLILPGALADDLADPAGLALIWNETEGWTAAITSPGGRRVTMHTDLRLGPVPSPPIVAQSVAAIIADGSLRAGQVLPGTAELLAQYLTPAWSGLGYPLRCAACEHCYLPMQKDTPTSRWEDAFGNPECAAAPNPDDGPMPGHEPGAPVISKPDVPVIPARVVHSRPPGCECASGAGRACWACR